jgi:mono/diheme cytochrome c family protein
LGQERELTVRSFLIVAVLASLAAPALADDYKSLPDGPGRDVTVRVCSQCHSPEIAAHQTLDAQGWKDLVNQMANNGANATDAEFDTITKYLTTAFPPK